MISYPLHLLIVEDNPHQAFAVERTLLKQIEDVRIRTVTTGEECVRQLSGEEWSAVILDYTLPGMNGVELIQEIRRRGWQLPLVMVTGQGDEEIAVHAMKAGASEYLVKSKGYLLKLPQVLEGAIEKSNLEGQLKEAEERYKNLAENANDLIFVMDPSRTISFVTNRVREILGYSPEEVVGKNLANFLNPDDPPKLEELLHPCRLGENRNLIELEVVTKQGKVRNLELSLSKIVSQQKVMAYQGIARDCTDRVALEKQILQKNRELMAMVSVSSAISHTLEIEEISKGALARIYDLAELSCGAVLICTFDETFSRVVTSQNLSARFLQRLAEKSLQEDLVKRVGNGVRPLTNREVEEEPVSRPSNQIKEICAEERIRSYFLFPFFFNEEVMGFLFGGRHIRKDLRSDELEILNPIVKQISIALSNARLFNVVQEAKREWETTFDTMTELVYTQDAEGRITRVNQALARRLKLLPRDIVNRKAVDIFQDPQSPWCHHQREEMYVRDKVISVEFEDKRLNGYFEISTTPVYTAEGRLFAWLFVGKDVTEQRKLQSQIVELERLTALGEMANGVAHDFNNLLAGILGKTQVLIKQLEQGPPTDVPSMKADLQTIEAKSIQGAQTVRRIQDFTRIGANQFFQDVQVNEVVEEAINSLRPLWLDQSRANGIQIDVQFEAGVVPPVCGSRAELIDAVRNVLRNALEAMPDGGTVRVATSLEENESNATVAIRIIDSGIGMPEEVRRKIFDPFFSTKGPKGAGLGMSVTYGIVRRHHGDIRVSSILGQGTTCVIALPAASKTAEVLPTHVVGPKEESIRLLVIDDEEVIREFMAEMLSMHGYRVDVAANGPEAIALFQAGHYDVIFSDLGLPGMTGWEIAKKIRSTDPKVPIVLLSGWNIQLDDARVKESGISLVLSKPCQMQDLLSAVKMVLGRSQSN
ncbi:MAG: response regulator [Terriglobia bacterium]